MIRDAGPRDQPDIAALLRRQTAAAMFPLANLTAHGLAPGGFASDHVHALRIWVIDDTSVIALTQGGMLLPLLAGTPDLSALRLAMAGMPVTGAVGPAASVRPLLAALGLAHEPAQEDRDEPGFTLDLVNLRIPDLPGAVLVPATRDHRDRLIDWRTTYHTEVLGTPPDKARNRAATDIDRYTAQDSHRLLLHHGQLVAMTGFNAVLPDIVQVGGVFTPPALRRRGYARTAVALHLAEARSKGVARAVLFAANAAAARAYQAIGFQPFQDFALVQYPAAVPIAACP
jgi:RimJ/RimL family protein N-acetyltransferase